MNKPLPLLICVEPPLSVSNSLLEVTRRLFGDLEKETSHWVWFPPELYVAPLIAISPNTEETRLFVLPVLEHLALQTPECGLQLQHFSVQQDGEKWCLYARLTDQDLVLEHFSDNVLQGLRETVVQVAPMQSLGVLIAYTKDQKAVEHLLANIETEHSAPLAGWLADEVQLMVPFSNSALFSGEDNPLCWEPSFPLRRHCALRLAGPANWGKQ